ncbi:MAG: YqiA/YcfP family alpha/beta fold hydrolase [Pseudomonadota bacterium]
MKLAVRTPGKIGGRRINLRILIGPGAGSVLIAVLFALITVFSTQTLMNRKALALEFGQFEEFTLHNAGEENLKDDVILIFHGFKSAMPNSAYKRIYKAFKDDYSIVGFNYDYFDIEANDAAFEQAWSKVLEGKNVIAAGTSLGGFWANYFTGKFGIEKLLIINPVVDPVSQLQQFIGRHYVEKRKEDMVVTAEDIENYRDLEVPTSDGTRRLVILTRDDKILDFQLAFDEYSNSESNKVVVFDQGGHTLKLDEPRFMSIIKNFIGKPSE